MSDPVREFLTRTFISAGGLVEDTTHGIEAVLPPGEAVRLGLPEAVDIHLAGSDPAQDQGVLDGRIGSPLLERLVSGRLERAPVAAVALPAGLPTPLPENLPVLLNAVRSRGSERVRTGGRFLNVELRLTLHGEELRSALISLTIRLADGARTEPFRVSGAHTVLTAPLDTRERANARTALVSWLQQQGPAVHAAALGTLERRARRDIERLAEYYASLDAEMRKAAQRARSDKERVRREAKAAALPADLASRRDQLALRIRPRLSARLVAATLVESDVEHFQFTVRRRSREGTVIMDCRMADGVFEGPPCAACGAAALRFYLCDDRLHVLCESCGQPGRLDPARCRACSGVRPAPTTISLEDPTAGLRFGSAF
jgi:hypothetical protein